MLERKSVADPDLELRGRGGGAVLIYLLCWPFSLQSFLIFWPKIRGCPGPPGPSPRSATANNAVGLLKQTKVGLDWEEFLCFGSLSGLFVSQHNLFRTMWPDRARGRSWTLVVEVIQFWITTIHLTTKPKLIYFLVINSYISFIQIWISEPDKNILSLNCFNNPKIQEHILPDFDWKTFCRGCLELPPLIRVNDKVGNYTANGCPNELSLT